VAADECGPTKTAITGCTKWLAPPHAFLNRSQSIYLPAQVEREDYAWLR
jgi:hypothetical protein